MFYDAISLEIYRKIQLGTRDNCRDIITTFKGQNNEIMLFCGPVTIYQFRVFPPNYSFVCLMVPFMPLPLNCRPSRNRNL